ncbi:MAG: chalcone isomerase family protein [Burkholderiales bacterium]
MRLVLAVIATLLPLAAAAVEVAGVKLDDRVRVAPNAPELVLNGAGLRTRFFLKVYVAGLYVTEKKTATADVLALGGPKRVAMSMLRDLTAQQLSDALNDGFRANNPPSDQERYKAQLAELTAIMSSLGAARTGDTVALDYLPEVGTRVLLNGEAKGKPIPDEGFYRGLLRVWLGENPVDADLKKGLLGQGS